MLSKNKKGFNPSYDDVPNIRFSLRLTEKLQDELSNYSQKCALILKCIEYALDNKEDINDKK